MPPRGAGRRRRGRSGARPPPPRSPRLLRARGPGPPSGAARRPASTPPRGFPPRRYLPSRSAPPGPPAVVARLGSDPTPSPSAVLAVIGLFVVIQWAWVGQVFYDTRFDPDDALHRVLVLFALVGAGAMTLGVDEVPESVLLPVGYLIVR